MTHPDMNLLFVDNPAASAAFYAKLLDTEPLESSPTFAMFKLKNGTVLGLWSKHTAEPRPTALGGGTELGFHVADRGEVERLHNGWKAMGLPILQEPVTMDFGYTFVALDPDQHRLRVFTPEGSA
jgi:predicted enzyme related to lactoylglutathione lyase